MNLTNENVSFIEKFFNNSQAYTKCFTEIYNYQQSMVSDLIFDSGDGNIAGFKRKGEYFRAYVIKDGFYYLIKMRATNLSLPFSSKNIEEIKIELKKNEKAFRKIYNSNPPSNNSDIDDGNLLGKQSDKNVSSTSTDQKKAPIEARISDDISGEFLDDASTDFEAVAIVEEKENAKRNYNHIDSEICALEKAAPYPEVGRYDTATDYDDISNLQWKKKENERYWNAINYLKQYYDCESLYKGHLLYGSRHYFLTEAYLKAKDLSENGLDAVLISVDDVAYADFFQKWRYPKKDKLTVFSRNVTIKNKQVTDVDIVYDINNELYSDITDKYLRNALIRNKNKNEIQSIIQTIQEKQDEIRVCQKDLSFIVQGCAGSGKTMVLLHRIRYLLYNNFLSSSDYYYLVPNDNFRSYLLDFSHGFGIGEKNVYSFTYYYRDILSKSPKEDEADLSETVFPQNFLKTVYSEYFIQQCFEYCINYVNDKINSLIDVCDSKLASLFESEKTYAQTRKAEIIENLKKSFNDTLNPIAEFVKNHYSDSIDQYKLVVQELETATESTRQKIVEAEQSIRLFQLSDETLKAYVDKDKQLLSIKEEEEKEIERIKKASVFTFLSHKHKLQRLESAYKTRLEQLKSDVFEKEKAKYAESIKQPDTVFGHYTIDDIKNITAKLRAFITKAETEIEKLNGTSAYTDENFSKKHDEKIKLLQTLIEKSSSFSEIIQSCVSSLSPVGDLLLSIIKHASTLYSAFEFCYSDDKQKKKYADEFKLFSQQTDAKISGYLYGTIFNYCKKQLYTDYEIVLCKKYKHYWFLSLYFTYLVKSFTPKTRKYIYIDEAQDLSLSELHLIYKINTFTMKNGSASCPVIELFGDVNQVITTYGINNWAEIPFIDKHFFLDENFRNTNQVVKYCNDELTIKMKAIGVDMDNVSVFNKFEEVDKTKSDTYIFIVKDEYAYDDLVSMIAPYGNAFKFNIFTVKTVKGLEFKEVYVFDQDMTDNEKYIAYTRSLIKLNVIKSLPVCNTEKISKIVQGENESEELYD